MLGCAVAQLCEIVERVRDEFLAARILCFRRGCKEMNEVLRLCCGFYPCFGRGSLGEVSPTLLVDVPGLPDSPGNLEAVDGESLSLSERPCRDVHRGQQGHLSCPYPILPARASKLLAVSKHPIKARTSAQPAQIIRQLLQHYRPTADNYSSNVGAGVPDCKT
jgi:hypothetical protein